jgi:hypothetical protein
MSKADTVWGVHKEGLRLERTIEASCRIANVPYSDIALKRQHVALLEHIAHKTRVLANEHFAFVASHDACCILTTVLQTGQRIVDLLINCSLPNNTDDAAHKLSLPRREAARA